MGSIVRKSVASADMHEAPAASALPISRSSRLPSLSNAMTLPVSFMRAAPQQTRRLSSSQKVRQQGATTQRAGREL
eukprot:scaffold53221_cov18-Prasinocladus_malaysianus.AAC.1